MAFTRRHLPHWIPGDTAVFVTWRLAGSLPRLTDDTNRSSVLPAFLQQDERLDGLPSGPDWLQDPRVVGVIVNALLYGETVRRFYQLHAWVIMPNHVHAIFQPQTAMPTIMRWLKGRTAAWPTRFWAAPGRPSGKTNPSTIGYGPRRSFSI
jgi:putative transposase